MRDQQRHGARRPAEVRSHIEDQIPQPNYLLAGQADGCIEKLSPELLHSQILAFATVLHKIDTMTAAQLKGA